MHDQFLRAYGVLVHAQRVVQCMLLNVHSRGTRWLLSFVAGAHLTMWTISARFTLTQDLHYGRVSVEVCVAGTQGQVGSAVDGAGCSTLSCNLISGRSRLLA